METHASFVSIDPITVRSCTPGSLIYMLSLGMLAYHSKWPGNLFPGSWNGKSERIFETSLRKYGNVHITFNDNQWKYRLLKNMSYVTFPFPGLRNLVIRQFEPWKLTSTGITRVPNRCIASSQASLSSKAKASPCECHACLFITVLHSLVFSLVGLNHYVSRCNETLPLFFFFHFFSCHLLQLLHASWQFLPPTPMESRWGFTFHK